jgi:hypothetical protein
LKTQPAVEVKTDKSIFHNHKVMDRIISYAVDVFSFQFKTGEAERVYYGDGRVIVEYKPYTTGPVYISSPPVHSACTKNQALSATLSFVGDGEIVPTPFGEKVFFLLKEKGITVTWKEIDTPLPGDRVYAGGRVERTSAPDADLLLRLTKFMPPHMRDEIAAYIGEQKARPQRKLGTLSEATVIFTISRADPT